MSDSDKSTMTSQGLPRFLTVVLGLAALLICLVVLKEFSSLISPIFLALNFMITAYPLHRWLVSRGTPSWLSAVVVALTVFAVLIAMVAGLVWSVNEMVALLPSYSNEFNAIYDQAVTLAYRFGFEADAVQSVWKMVDPNSVIGAAGSFVSGASGIFSTLVVILASLAFIAMDTPGFDSRMKMLSTSRHRMAIAMTSFAQGIRRYWWVTTVFGLIVAILDGIALVILGVPLAVVWALFSFLTNYIPNIGFVVGLIPPALVALFAKDWQTAVLVIVIYSLLNFVIQSIIQPRFAGESVGVTPTISFISLLVWAAVLGGMGTLLALPMTLLIKALLVDSDPDARWVNALIASDPAESTREP